ncbi:hypothetical protein TNCV_260641 [Trichonephila clavipes]|nr:hypothetical protein TNCV_260641 [Trichonephila clavipes]
MLDITEPGCQTKKINQLQRKIEELKELLLLETANPPEEAELKKIYTNETRRTIWSDKTLHPGYLMQKVSRIESSKTIRFSPFRGYYVNCLREKPQKDAMYFDGRKRWAGNGKNILVSVLRQIEMTEKAGLFLCRTSSTN